MPPTQQHPAHQAHHPAPRRKKVDWAARTVRIEFFILLVGVALLLLALSLWLATGNGPNKESNHIKTDKYQAVFLNGGVTSGAVSYSTYFGHITSMNDKYVVLNNVYYLTDQQGSNNQSNPQLTKLGCQQLHSPDDEMIINRNQVAFWENLQDNGKVVTAIKEFQKQNPNGPNCSAATAPTTNTTPQTTSPTPSTNR